MDGKKWKLRPAIHVDFFLILEICQCLKSKMIKIQWICGITFPFKYWNFNKIIFPFDFKISKMYIHVPRSKKIISKIAYLCVKIPAFHGQIRSRCDAHHMFNIFGFKIASLDLVLEMPIMIFLFIIT